MSSVVTLLAMAASLVFGILLGALCTMTMLMFCAFTGDLYEEEGGDIPDE